MNYVFLGSYFPKDKVEEITGKVLVLLLMLIICGNGILFMV